MQASWLNGDARSSTCLESNARYKTGARGRASETHSTTFDKVSAVIEIDIAICALGAAINPLHFPGHECNRVSRDGVLTESMDVYWSVLFSSGMLHVFSLCDESSGKLDIDKSRRTVWTFFSSQLL